MMGIDGSNPLPLIYSANGPTGTEIDADPHWGPDNRITFKREDLGNASRYSRVYTATIETATGTLSDVTLRTDNPDQILIGNAAGDGWIETMPSWNTDPMQPDTLVYSGSR